MSFPSCLSLFMKGLGMVFYCKWSCRISTLLITSIILGGNKLLRTDHFLKMSCSAPFLSSIHFWYKLSRSLLITYALPDLNESSEASLENIWQYIHVRWKRNVAMNLVLLAFFPSFVFWYPTLFEPVLFTFRLPMFLRKLVYIPAYLFSDSRPQQS